MYALSQTENQGKSVKFEKVQDIIEEEGCRWNDDQIVEVSSLHATPEGLLELPDVGRMVLTPWSRQQIAQALGIRWDRWFEHASGIEAAEEINRRLSRKQEQWKLRTRLPRRGEVIEADGVLGAVVSPTYTPIADSRVFASLLRSVGREWLSGLNFFAFDLTDRSTHLGMLTKRPFAVGSGTRRETYHAGFYVRNSQVGFTALTIFIYFLRIVCSNGLLVSDGEFRLLYRTHRPIEDGLLDSLMIHAFSSIETLWSEGLNLLDASHSKPLNDPESQIAALLRQSPGLRQYHQPVMAELKNEGLFMSRFNVIQAITRVAQSIPAPDQRFDMERLAGSLLVE